MTKIKVLIVDDEPGAHKVLQNYIARIPDLELVGNSYNVPEALSFLKANPVNVILLDITMPEADGFSLLTRLPRPPFVIFTTAHSEYALESYEHNAVDYLKKPVRFERFTSAINKLRHWIEKDIVSTPFKSKIDIKIDGIIVPLDLQDVLYIQSLGNYVKIFLANKCLVTQVTTSDLERILPKTAFARIHKSFIVNKEKIEKFSDDELIIAGKKLPVGKTFKKYVKEIFSDNFRYQLFK